MNIAYVIDPMVVISGRSNGVRSQAMTWKEGMEAIGHKVTLINVWEHFDWGYFDIIHLFGSGGIWFWQFAKGVASKNNNLVFSPICDDIDNPRIKKIKTYLGFSKFNILSFPFVRKKSYKYFKGVLARSSYEAEYLKKAYGVEWNKLHKVPLSYSANLKMQQRFDKESFCLHISSIYQPRKNVLKLIEAAKKYDFKLVLAGSKGSVEQFEPIKKAIGDAQNIKVLGFISEKEKIELYKRAKVFALPSIMEGVGIVALDAAVFGCDIVITNIGAPQEYYDNKGHLVDPYSVESIGKAVVSALEKKSDLNILQKHIRENYSLEKTMQALVESYHKVLSE